MEALEFANLSIEHAMNKQATGTSPAGFLHKLKVGETDIKAHLDAYDPKEHKHEKVAAVLSYFGWAGGENDPILLRGLLHESALATFLSIADDNKKMKVNAVKFDLLVYDHNQSYFTAVKSTNCESEFTLRDEKFWISASTKPALGRHYYRFEIAVAPKKAHQNEIHYARLKDHNNSAFWGTKG